LAGGEGAGGVWPESSAAAGGACERLHENNSIPESTQSSDPCGHLNVYQHHLLVSAVSKFLAFKFQFVFTIVCRVS
jgi:hypothetical protein